MKYLLILADGMADYLIPELGNKTPLQVANTPNMDKLAKSALIGTVKTIPEGYPPGSDVANLSVMGYDPRTYYTGRSPLEAVSMGVALGDNDLALRCNLVTLSDEKNYQDKTMLDYSSGEISSDESGQLMAAINQELGNNELKFYAGVSYRHLLVWQNGSNRSFTLTPPHDISDRKVTDYLPAGKDGKVLLDLMVKSESILKNHPVNQARIKKGLRPATSIWFWGEGRKPSLNSFPAKYGLKGSVVAAVDLVKGLGICAGLKSVTVEGATGGIVTNFAGKARAALDELKAGQDFVYMHIESPDESGHQGELKTKIWSIEQVDKEVVGLVLSEMDEFEELRIMLLPDHPTPLSVRTHTSDPVPYLIYDKNHPVSSSTGKYDEQSALNGQAFGSGYELMDYFIRS
ncbi:MAG: cofactor-independent phosphoglycerate mutase [Syntrophomonadaceae bacterium]|nr:cofactor-independent phosphoglycerate mutase [Syntrophomonadaceae bacterium]MDD4548572.1 cofactor-independent phosphoglycerate mutase [Syntrophomonadaceae bacterium]